MSDLMADLEALLSRPTLAQRALAAKAEAKAKEDAHLAAEGEALYGEAVTYMRETLLMTPGEIADIEMTSGRFNPERAIVNFKVEGIEFRIRYKQEKIMDIDNGGTKVPIYESVPYVESLLKGTWRECSNLVRLGEMLS